ncbi:MAG: B-box zinc finger protein [Acidobacteriota bacterium]
MNEIWQVKVNDQICETDTTTLRQWVSEGRILPNDKVRKGSLKWIEAQRVPTLREAFSQLNHSLRDLTTVYQPEKRAAVLQAVCQYHQELPPDFICAACVAAYCRDCTKSLGSGSASICVGCGNLCRPYAEVREKVLKLADRQTALGFADLKLALRYSLQEPFALLFAAVIYGVVLMMPTVSFGFMQTISNSLAFSAATIFASLLTIIVGVIGNAVLFTSLCAIINRVSVGNLDTHHLFDFSALLADIAHTMSIGLAITTVAGGPLITIVLVIILGALRILSGTSDLNLLLSNPFKLLLLLSLLWAVFYYPLALIVGGVTQQPRAIINPLVGLQTMHSMGDTYLKALLIYLSLCLLGGSIVLVILTITIPLFGFILGLPVYLLVGLLIYYLNAVAACLFGRALFKCADQLGLSVN